VVRGSSTRTIAVNANQDAGAHVDASEFSHFERAMLDSGNESATCVLLVLAWIMATGGNVVQSDVAKLSEIAGRSDCDIDVEYLFGIAHRRDLDAIQLACEVVQRTYYGDKAQELINVAIACAISDGKLHPGKNFILRFLADLLGVDRSGLNRMFAGITGKPIPGPEKIHSAEYWEHADKHQRSRSYSHRSQSSNVDNDEDPFMFAYDELGLPETATVAEIRAAYRKLAQQHHPDRVASMGEEAVAEATVRFQRIQESYEYLMKHA